MAILGTDIDGVTRVYDDEIVDASGDITLMTNNPHAHNFVKKAQAGLKSTYILKPMRMDIVTQTGTSKGSIGRIAEVVISFFKTLGAKYGRDTDNLYVIPEVQPTEKENLLKNSSFELGDQDWVKGSGWSIVEDVANAYIGDYVLKYLYPGSGSGWVYSWQEVKVSEGEIYKIVGYAKNGAGSARNMKIYINIVDKDSGRISSHSSLPVVTGTTYTRTAIVLTVPATAVGMRIIPMIEAVGAGDVGYFDMITVYKIVTASAYTGDVVVSTDGGFGVEDNFVISGDDPLPCVVRAIVPRKEKTGR